MTNVRLLSFSYTYSITGSDDSTADFPKSVENTIRLHTAGVTPVPTEDRSETRKPKSVSTSSSAVISLHEIERVLPIYLRVYYKENEKLSTFATFVLPVAPNAPTDGRGRLDRDKMKRSIVEYEIKNNETLNEMLSMMLRKLKALKGKTEAKGRMYLTQRKFQNPAELDYRRHACTVIEDFAKAGKSIFFVFDMAGRLDSESRQEHVPRWIVKLPT